MIRQRFGVMALACMTAAAVFTGLGCGGGGSNGGPSCSSKNPLNVAGTYNLSTSGIDSSTCPPAFTSAVEDALSGLEGTQTFTQSGAVVNLEAGVSGCVDDQGNVRARIKPQSQSQGGCTVTVGGAVDLHLMNNPSHGTIAANVKLSSGCHAGFSRCTVVVALDVNKLTSARSSSADVELGGGDEIVSTAFDKVLEAAVKGQ